MNFTEYIPGNSFIHRILPKYKLLMLVFISILLLVFSSFIAYGLMLFCLLCLYILTHISINLIWKQLKPFILVLCVIFIAQLFFSSWQSAVLVIMRLVILLLMAALVMLTTRSSDILDVLEKALSGLRYVGINPAKVSFAISLSLRFIPVIAAITSEIKEAQRARGLESSIIAIAIPLIVKILKMADDIAAAIEARSYNP
ncbi:energy-coupling factor transporter transmembrane component T family protein [Xenorhabdus budapestensis]|uniref:Energy-coupling factor transporter transmembrane protein EcfT n=1 Tax=Xenorhabdus budapestensis TaxID=290110 RepID=A0ABX7VF35_XENBU|nr:energy-coupling factor transporter transmembrane protein EcfT [Xenorhabdus budapestensis]QTL39404.1 energy-coupling factor transporter transmembrane protein EcfT [Xenorhabdus budapestensis]